MVVYRLSSFCAGTRGQPDAARAGCGIRGCHASTATQPFPFRTQWNYQNVLYALGGELVERISGRAWHEFVRERILVPLGSVSARAIQQARERLRQ